MANGWIKIHRKFIEWEWYDDMNTKTLFIHCLLMANHEPKKWRGEIIERGSFITSIGKLAEGTQLSIQNVRTCLKNLESTGEVTRKSTSKLTKLTICKYGTYQSCEISTNKQTNSQLTINQQSTNNQLTTTKEYKELKELKKDKKVNQKNIQERIEDFSELVYLEAFKQKSALPKSEVENFIGYWTEHGPNDKKVRFEREKTFGISRRLGTWLKNFQKRTPSRPVNTLPAKTDYSGGF